MLGRVLARRAYSALASIVPPELDEVWHMWRALGYVPNIRHPRTFNEKIAHRKLFVTDPRFTQLTDKWAVRQYVKSRIGDEYLVHVYQCVEEPTRIRFKDLPRSFAIKATHDCGSTVLVRDKTNVDWEKLVAYFRRRLQQRYGVRSHERHYEQIPPRLVVEELIRDKQYGLPLDFKMFVFHGRARYIRVGVDRARGLRLRYYDPEWTPLDVRHPRYALAPAITRPRRLGELVSVAERLALGFDFVRVDLYAPDDHGVLFGEMTFTPAAGRGRFIPDSFDWELGRLW